MKNLIRLKGFEGGMIVINTAYEKFIEAEDLPASEDGKLDKRTRLTTTNHVYLSSDSAADIAKKFNF